MQDFLKNSYDVILNSIESRKKTLNQNIDIEISEAKNKSDSEVIAVKFSEISQRYNHLIEELKIKLDKDVADLKAKFDSEVSHYNEVAENAKKEFKDKVYYENEAQVRLRHKNDILELDAEIDFIKNHIEKM